MKVVYPLGHWSDEGQGCEPVRGKMTGVRCAKCDRELEELEEVILMLWAVVAPVTWDTWAAQRFADPPICAICQACAKNLEIAIGICNTTEPK